MTSSSGANHLANKDNGLRRTNEEKQEAVKHALQHPQAKGMSDRKIAEHVDVHHSTIADWRKKLEPPEDEGRIGSESGGGIRHLNDGDVNENAGLQDSTEPGKRVGRDGRTYDTTNVSAANKAWAKPQSPLLTSEAEDDLCDILHLKPGADERWQRRQDQGLSDDHLNARIITSDESKMH